MANGHFAKIDEVVLAGHDRVGDRVDHLRFGGRIVGSALGRLLLVGWRVALNGVGAVLGGLLDHDELRLHGRTDHVQIERIVNA